MPRHTSTSRPRQFPCASGAEKPATPVLTPHWTKPFRRTPSRVGVAAADVRPDTGARPSGAPAPEHAASASTSSAADDRRGSAMVLPKMRLHFSKWNRENSLFSGHPRQLLEEPGPRVLPVALQGRHRHAQRLRRLALVEPGEEA